MWGQRIWQPRPTSYQAQGPHRGRRNVQGWTRKVQTAGRHRKPRSRKEKAAHPRRQSFQASQTKGPTQWASYRGVVEEQFQERLSLQMPITDSLATLMRKWPLNSITQFAATHSRLRMAADRTSTQVATCMINKLMAKINGEEIYNTRDPSRIEKEKEEKDKKKDGRSSYHPRKLP